MQRNKFIRIGYNITASQVRLVENGDSVGVVSIQEALERAAKAELDLVEIVPNARPPVCEIMDFGKWKYEQKIKKKESERRNKAVQNKEIQLRYSTGQHDIETKVKSLKKFLEEKRQVKLVVKFKNRELSFRNLGEQVLKQMIAAVAEDGDPQSSPRMEGKNMVVNIVPKKE